MLLRLLAFARSCVPSTLTVPTFNSFNSRAINNTCRNASLTASMFRRRNAQIVSWSGWQSAAT